MTGVFKFGNECNSFINLETILHCSDHLSNSIPDESLGSNTYGFL